METTTIVALASVLMGAIAGYIAPRLRKYISRRDKKIISINEAGNEEVITAPADASLSEIESRVQRSLELEALVADTLKRLEQSNSRIKFHVAKSVDFVATQGDRKLAIEVKFDPKTFNMAHVRRYLAAEPGIDRVLIVSPGDLPLRLRREIEKPAYSDSVRFVKINDDRRTVEEQIGTELNALLGPARG